jgi:hypothetical protein
LSWLTPSQARDLLVQAGFVVEACYGTFDRTPFDEATRKNRSGSRGVRTDCGDNAMIGTTGLKGLQIDCIVGIHEHERRTPQTVSIDIEMDYDFEAAPARTRSTARSTTMRSPES